MLFETVRNLGLTTNRNGEIVQSGTLHRATNMNSFAKNKSSDHLVQQASTPSSQSPTVLSGTVNKLSTGRPNGQEGTLPGRDAVTDNTASKRAATLDRSWRTKDSGLSENLPQVGGTFSFDLERDAQVLLDMLSTPFEEKFNVVDSRRLNSTPSTPGYDSGQMTVIRRLPQQKSSSSGDSLRVQMVACDVPRCDEKPVLPTNGAIETPGFNKTSNGNQTPYEEFDEVSFKSKKVDAGPQESHNITFNKVAIGASNVHTTPSRPQESSPYGVTEVDSTSVCSKKFSAADNDVFPGYSLSLKDTLNDAKLSPEAGNNGVLYDHRAEPVLRSISTPGGHMGVSAQRGYASDSEDPMDWLEQQRAKLKLKLCREGSTIRSKLDPRLLKELKIRQKILGRTPVDEKESLVSSLSSDGAQNSKIGAHSPELYYREYGHRILTPDFDTGWSDSYTLKQNYSQSVGGPDRRVGTPEFDQNRRGQHFAKEIQSPGHGSRSLTLSKYANGVPLNNCSTDCDLNPTRTTDTNSESAKGTNFRSSEQREVHETCISKKIIPEHRGN